MVYVFKIRVNYIVNLQKLFIMAAHNFKTTLDLTVSPPQFKFEDTSSVGANVYVNFKITSPSGVVIYDNTAPSRYNSLLCDIHDQTSPYSQQTIVVPNINGIVEQGTYTIEGKTKIVNSYYSKINTIEVDYVSPEVCIIDSVDCVSPILRVEDITDYVKNGVTPTKDRELSLLYPAGTAGYGNPITTSGAVISTNTFYNGLQVATLSVDLTYTMVSGGNGFVILDSLSGQKDINVSCVDICSLLCCIKTSEQMACAASGQNKADLTIKFNTVMALVGLIQLSVDCGQGDSVSGYIEQIKKITNCNNCKCSDEQPSQVVGIGSILNNVVVTSGDAYINVATSVVGTLTTYTLTLSQSLIDIINQNTDDIETLQTQMTSVLASTIVSSNESIVVTNTNTPPAAPSYDLVVKLKNQFKQVVSTQTIGTAGNVKITDLSITIPVGESGNYICMFEADAVQPNSGYFIPFTYTFDLNDGTYSPYPSNGSLENLSGDDSTCKLTRIEKFYFNENDTLDVVISTDKTFDIVSGSLTIFRVF